MSSGSMPPVPGRLNRGPSIPSSFTNGGMPTIGGDVVPSAPSGAPPAPPRAVPPPPPAATLPPLPAAPPRLPPAPVLPVPPAPTASVPGVAPAAQLNLRQLLEEVIERDASDLHITVGERPMLRVDGDIVPARTNHVLSGKDCLQLAYSVLTEAQKKRFELDDELDFSFGIASLARFRGNLFKQRGNVAMVVRRIPMVIPTCEELNLPPAIVKFAERPRGLVLVTGPTGSGKSTTLASLIDKVNRERQAHILTVEDPIEFVHKHQQSLVNQREVGTDTRSFSTALKYALREDPDVILVGEMRDLETIQAAITIAETGHLAFATLHTNSAAEAVNRMIDVFPSHQQSQVRAQLAFTLEGIVTQTLLPRASGRGRVMAAEVLVITPAIRALIRDDKVHQIYSMMQSGKKYGMQTLNDSLYQLYISREVTEEECLRVTGDPVEFLRMIGKPIPPGMASTTA